MPVHELPASLHFYHSCRVVSTRATSPFGKSTIAEPTMAYPILPGMETASDKRTVFPACVNDVNFRNHLTEAFKFNGVLSAFVFFITASPTGNHA